MKTIVLDFTDKKVKILHHWDMHPDDIEAMLFDEDKYDLPPNNIQWMTVEDLIIQNLPPEENVMKTTFSIDEFEILKTSWKRYNKDELKTILNFIENDEILWDAIETAKLHAINHALE